MTQNQRLNQWIEELKTLCEPDAVVICDGSKSEYDQMMGKLVDAGVAKPLNASLRPNSFLVRSDPADVARVESRTFICSQDEADAGDPAHHQRILATQGRLIDAVGIDKGVLRVEPVGDFV